LEEQLFYDGRSSFLLPLDLLKKDACVSSDKIDFTKPISWNYYRTYRHNNSYWNTSLDVKVEIYIEQMSATREKAISGNFTLWL
jgi:acyl-CoA hydrolase